MSYGKQWVINVKSCRAPLFTTLSKLLQQPSFQESFKLIQNSSLISKIMCLFVKSTVLPVINIFDKKSKSILIFLKQRMFCNQT